MKMKCLVVIPSFYPATVYGGPIFTSWHTCRELSKLGVPVDVSTTNANLNNHLDVATNSWIEVRQNLRVKYYHDTVVGKFSFSMLFGLWEDIKGADVVHVQGLFNLPVPLALLYARLQHKPVLLTPHGVLGAWCLQHGSRLKPYWLWAFIKPFGRYVTWHATAEMERAEIHAIFPDAEIRVIPNGIDLDEFKCTNELDASSLVRKFTGRTLEAEQIIVSMGRLQRKKGFDILIEALDLLRKEYPTLRLLIAGPDEGAGPELNRQITDKGLSDHVFLVGSVTGQEKIDFLANADVFALPSHNENFGVVFAESLAAGTPIVASKNTPWIGVYAAGCGCWVNNTSSETASAIREILERDRTELRKKSLSFIETYDWKNIASMFSRVFGTMLEKGSSGAR